MLRNICSILSILFLACKVRSMHYSVIKRLLVFMQKFTKNYMQFSGKCHRWNKNSYTQNLQCNVVITLQKNLKFSNCTINLHNVSNASCCFLSFIYLKMCKILYHRTALHWLLTWRCWWELFKQKIYTQKQFKN